MTNDVSAIAITPSQLAETLAYTLPYSSVMLWGNVGIGKSQILREQLPALFPRIVAAVEALRNIQINFDPETDEVRIVEIRLGDFDLLDIAGVPFVQNGKQRRALSDLWVEPEEGKRLFIIYLFDEFPQASRAHQTVIQRLGDEGRVSNYELAGHPKTDYNCEKGLGLCVFAGNRQKDKAQSVGMGNQTGTRLVHYTLTPSTENWLTWGAENDIDPVVLAWIKQMPEYLHKLDPNQRGQEHPTGCTPRGLEKLSHALRMCPPPELEMSIYSGIIGEEAARSFIAICHAGRSINIDEAFTDPDNAPIPDEVGHQFATASLLIRRATKDNFANIVTYLSRHGEGGWSSPEIMVFVVEAIKRRVPIVAETATYRDWSLKWADIRS